MVEDFAGQEVDREHFEVTSPLLNILQQGTASDSDIARKLYRDYLNGATTLTLEEIAKLASVRAAKETQPVILGAVSDYVSGRPVAKEFPLGKLYCLEPIHGLKERRSPAEMTELLVYGLISQKPAKIEVAGEKFDPGLLDKARQYVPAVQTFQHIREHLRRVLMGDEESARYILQYFRQCFGGVEPVMDLVEGVHGLFTGQEDYDFLACRMQRGNIFDVTGSDRLMTCTLLPSSTTASLFYHLDRYIALLQMVPFVGKEELDPIGAGILAECRTAYGERVLLVDSVEGGMQIDRLRESAWKNMMYSSISGAADDVDAGMIAVNVRTAGVKAKKYISHVRRMTGLEPETIYLEKVGGMESVQQYGIQHHGLEAFGRSQDNELKGEVSCILLRR